MPNALQISTKSPNISNASPKIATTRHKNERAECSNLIHIKSKYHSKNMTEYPHAIDPEMVGEYPATAKSGGGYVWDEVLEYRVWCHPERGAEDLDQGNDYYYAFSNFEEAKDFSDQNAGTEEPIALILQREYIDEPESGTFAHIKEERITEWSVEFLKRPKRTETTIPEFFAPNAPPNRLEILRGLA
jgi:putative acetyltransferase